MPSEDPAGAHNPRRLHPTSLLFSFLRHVKAYALPAILVLFFSRGDQWELWLGLILIPAMVFEIYRYISLRYRLLSDELVVTEGVFFRNERHIPFARIQNIDLVQGPLQRLLGVADVRIETAGGSEPEAILRVLLVSLVAEMRQRIFAGRREFPERDEQAPVAPLVHLTARDILLLGLDPGRGLALCFVLLGAAWEFDLLDDLAKLREFTGLLNDVPVWSLILLGSSAALVGLALLVLLSVIWIWLRLGGFRVERSGEDFRMQSGVLTRLSATIPGHRIQSITVRQSLLQRALARCAVKIETAGGGESEGNLALVLRRWFAPLIRESRLTTVVEALEPGLEFDALEWSSLGPLARRRMTRKAVLVALATSLVLGLVFWPWGAILTLVLVPLAVLHAGCEARFAAWARPAGGLAYRCGVLARSWHYVSAAKLQAVARLESPFDRRHQMASLGVDTAGTRTLTHRISVPYLDRDLAEELRSGLALSAEEAGFSWR